MQHGSVEDLYTTVQVLALPISCDASMPDYIVKADVFDRGMKRHWHHSDRFRMFFATSYGHKAGWFLCRAQTVYLCVHLLFNINQFA